MLTDSRGYNEVKWISCFKISSYIINQKSSQCFPRPRLGKYWDSRESKLAVSSRDQSLSVYCLPLHCYMGRFYIVNIRSLALCFSIVEALLYNASPRQYCEVTFWNCSCSPKMCCRRLPASSYNLVKKQLDSRQRLRDQQWKCFYSQLRLTYYTGRRS